MKNHYPILILLSIGSLWLLSSCAPFLEQSQMQVDPAIFINMTAGQNVGQTFVARHDGLESVSLWLAGEVTSSIPLTLHLRTMPHSIENLRSAHLVIEPGATPGWYHFDFAPVVDSQNQYYYVVLESSAPLQVGAGPGDSYLDGALHQNHQPVDAQLTFQLTYAPIYIALELGRSTLINVGWLCIAFLLYVIPGWAMWVSLWQGPPLRWVETFCVAIGLSVALYPLLFLWTYVIGLNLGPVYTWLPPLVGSVALLWRYRDWRPQHLQVAFRQWWLTEQFWADITLVIIGGLGLAVRLYVIQGLEIPMWGDSYQHTMITQLLVDHNGLFSCWAPYAPISTFTYHFGLHTLVAVFHWATRMPLPQAMLWCTQWLNFCAVLVLYLLARQISTKPWGKVGSVLIAGLLTSMPMFYVNWGRYTQLTGQVLLPIAVWLTWELWRTKSWSRHHFVLAWLLVGGLALVHYRVLIFYVIFVIVIAGYTLWQRTWRQDWGRLFILGVGSVALVFPWLVNTLSSKMLTIAQSQLTRSPSQTAGSSAIGNLDSYLTPILWLILSIAAAVGLWQRRKPVLILIAWWFGLLIAAYPNWLYLPGSGIITGFTVFIAAYMPASLLISTWIEGGKPIESLRNWCMPILCVVLTGLGLWGVFMRLRDLQRAQHALVTRPDVMAMEWIKENTPPDAIFMVNGFLAYNGKAVVGSDGGWWLPLLGDRANIIPPLSYTVENVSWEGYRTSIRELFSFVQTHGIDNTDTVSFLRERGITHIYIGQRQGRVNYSGPEIISPTTLSQSNEYHLIYHKDLVWIFALR